MAPPGLRYQWHEEGNSLWELEVIHAPSGKIVTALRFIKKKRDSAAVADRILSRANWNVDAGRVNMREAMNAVDALNLELDKKDLILRRWGPYTPMNVG